MYEVKVRKQELRKTLLSMISVWTEHLVNSQHKYQVAFLPHQDLSQERKDLWESQDNVNMDDKSCIITVPHVPSYLGLMFVPTDWKSQEYYQQTT